MPRGRHQQFAETGLKTRAQKAGMRWQQRDHSANQSFPRTVQKARRPSHRTSGATCNEIQCGARRSIGIAAMKSIAHVVPEEQFIAKDLFVAIKIGCRAT